MPENKKCYYEVLGIPKGTSDEATIKKVRSRGARVMRGSNCRRVEELMVAVNLPFNWARKT